MTNSRFASKPRTFFNLEAPFVKYLIALVFVMGTVFTQVNATITVNSTPQTNNDFCGTGSPSLILPIVATSNCATGSITYQWYVGSTFGSATAITASGTPNYSGWNTSTLNVNNAATLGSNTTYWAVATESSGACADVDTLGPFNYVKVNSVPTVTLTPSSPYNVCEGDEAQFNAAVTAPSPAGVLTYTWSKTPDGGSATTVQTTSDTLSTVDTFRYNTILVDDQDVVQVSVANACGSGTSPAITVNVNPVPDVTVPSSMSTIQACEGDGFNVSYTISNAAYDPSTGGNANWSISFSGDAALIALLTSSGSGNTGVSLSGIGGALTPGAYSATVTTITNTSDGCPRSVSTNTINVNIYPKPTVTFSATPTNICNGSGSGTSFSITVANAEYTVGASTVAVNWSVSISESSFAQVTGCTGGSAGLLGATLTGNGNGTFNYTIPTSMGVGIYQYTLNSITNTSNACTGSVIGTSSVDWRVDPTPNIAVVPTSNSVCEGNSTTFQVNVTNAEYCGTTPGSGTPTNAAWSMNYTDATNSTIGVSPLTGSGNGIQGPYTTNAALTQGVYTFTPGTISVTTPATPGCSRNVSANTFTLTVNPNPAATFSTSSITQCEGTSGTTFSIDITNAALSGVGQNWQVNYTETGASALSGTPCSAGTPAGILTGGNVTGTGNGSTTFTIPSTLAPGYYTYTLTSVSNTSGGCSGTIGANPTITIIIEPAPIITMNPDTKDVCENDAESFNLSITNTTGCSGIGTTTTANWQMTIHTDNVQSDATTVIGAGLNGAGNSSYTIGVNTGGTLSPNDHIFDASVVNSTGATTCAGTSIRDTFTVSVDPRPDVMINGVSGDQDIYLCQGEDSVFNVAVTNALHNAAGVNWEITYTETSGQVASGCNGAITVDLPGASGSYTGSGNGSTPITIPNTLPVGTYTYTITNIVNTDGPCTGTVDGVTFGPQSITIHVYPKPSFTVQPDSTEVCEGTVALNDFALVVTNAQYCSDPSTIANANWEISGITDGVASNAPDPITGAGNGSTATYNSNVGTALTAGSYTYIATTITTTGLSTNCANVMTSDTSHVLTVNPTPYVEINGTSGNIDLYMCEGEDSVFSFDVTNAELHGSGVNWEITYTETSGQVNSGCNGAITADIPDSSGSYTGIGNGSNTISIPDTLSVGTYTYTVTRIQNTDASCDGAVDPTSGVGTQSITIHVYPKPIFTVQPDSSEICEGNIAFSDFTLNVTNAQYCSDPSTIANANWEISGITDNLSSNAPDPITGAGNVTTSSYNSNTTGLLTAGSYTYIATTITTTGLSTNCANVMTSDTSHVLTVNPTPDASFTTATISVCEGDTASVNVSVTNAVLNGDNVNWSYNVSETSGNLTSSCLIDSTENASIARDTTGAGNSVINYQIPNTLVPGVYTYTISNVLNTDATCTGSSATSTVTIYVYPKIAVEIVETDDQVCEGETSSFEINVTNARYCTALNTASQNAPWSLDYTDETSSNIFPDPLTGSGNSSFTFTANVGGLLSAGVYEFRSETVTAGITSPTVASCPVEVRDTFVLTINPEPEVTFSASTVNLCEGDATGTFDITVSNAQYTYGASTVEANWEIDMVGDSTTVANSCISGGAGAGLFVTVGTNNINGTGDTTISVSIPGTLEPGVYVYTLNGIVNTSNTCTGTVTTIPTITINVFPKPDVDLSTDTLVVCENTTETFTLEVSNAQYCGSIGGSLIDVNWEITHTDATQSNVPSSVWAGTGNVGPTTYTVNLALSLGAGSSPYYFDIAQIENITHSCVNTDSFSGEELTVIVNDLPVLTINSVSSSVCDGDAATINYSVSDVEATDNWSFTFTTDGGTTNLTVSGTGPVSGVDTTTFALTPPGVKTIAFSSITNTTTGCVGNTPSSTNITVLDLPDVTSFAASTGTNVCSGLSNSYDFTVANSAGKTWQIWVSVDGGADTSWTGIGNGSFTRGIPVQFHQDSVGAFDNRPITIDSMAWISGAGTPPLCFSTSFTDGDADLNVMPRPWINLTAPTNVCINFTADIEYFVGGVRSSDIWDFDWYTTGPADGPNNITGSDTTTGTFTTLPLTPVGTSNVNVPTVTNTSTGCDSSFASSPWSEDITVDPPTVPGTLTPNYTICDGDPGPYVFTLTGYTGDVQNWDSSDNDGFTWYNIGNTTDTHTVVSPHLTTRYHVVVKSGACPADTSNEVILFVHPQPAAQFVSIDDSICENSNVNVVFGVTGVPNTHTYEIDYTVSNGTSTTTGTWTGTGSSATITETLTNGGGGFSAGSWFISMDMITNNNTGCDTTLTDTIRFEVKSNPVGSTASTANDTLCSGSGGFVRWDGTAADGYVVKWQKKTPSASTWTDISGSAADSIEFVNLTATTQFRAVIENAPCTGQATSTPVTITVLSTNPTASWVSLPSSIKFCASTTTTTTLTYNLSGTNGYNWTLTLLEDDSTHVITGTGDGNATFTTSPGQMLESFNITLVQLVISSGSFSCTKNLDNTGIANIKVIDIPTATLNSVTSQVCDGDRVTMSVTVGDIKASESWELDYTINGVAFDTTFTGSGTFTWEIPYTVSGGNATQTVALTSIENTTAQTSASTTCSNSLSQSLTYEVRGTTAPGAIGTSASVCKGAAGSISQTTASTNGSVITDWLYSTDGGSTWASTGNTATTQNYLNIQTTTHYRAVYSNSPCDTASSNTVVITVKELPTGTIALAAGSDTICEGSTADITLTVTNIDNGQTFTVNYTEGSTTKSVNLTNNASNTHTITTGTITSTTDITLTTISTTSGTACSNSNLNSTVTVTVQEKPTATIASYDNTLCHGDNVDLTITVGNVGSTDSWTISGTLDGNAETFSGTGTGTFSFTTSNTVTSNSDVLALTNIVNNSTQDNCNSNPAASVTITVDPTTVAGTIGAAAVSRDTIVCLGGSGYVAEYTAGTGSITKWQSRRNGTSTWVDINSTNTTQFFFNLNDTTEYRAVYQSGVCASDFSNIITATPKALPVAVISTIVDDSICAGETADFEVTVTNVDVGSTFEIEYKEGSVSKTSATLTQNASGVHTLTTSALTANTLVQLTSIEVLSTTSASVPACSNSLNSNGTVTVLDLPFASITAGPDTLCQQDKIVFTVTVTNVLSTDNWSLRYELENDEDTITGTGPGSVTWVDTDSNTAESAKIQLIEILNLSNVGTCKSVNTDDWDIYIYKPTEPGTIVASTDTICKGGNTSIAEVTGTPKQGVTVSWEYKPISASNWTALNNNNTTLNILNLQETTDYRAVYKSGVCDTAHSNVVRIQVEELPLATLSGNTTICAGDSASLTVTVSNVGTNQDWELDYYAGTLSGQLTGTGSGTHTLRVGNFITNADVVLREIETVTGTPQCLNDKLTNNAQARININQRPYASLNSVVTPICQNATSSFSFTVSNVRSGDDWTMTYQVDDAHTSPVTTNGKGPGTFTLTTPALTTAKTYSVNLISITNTTTGCDSTLSGSMDIVVDATTVAGSVASDTTVCYGAHVGTVNHTGGNGSIVRWETSQDGGTSWATIQNTNSAYTYTNLTKTSLFRVVKQNGVCDEASTSPVTVTINELPTAVISGSDTICAGTDANLTVSVTNTQGEDWRVSYLVGTVLDTISVSGPLTTGTINTGTIKTNTDVTLKKVWMTSGTPQCENDDLNNNATATVEVDDEPNATLISLTDSVCTGSPAYGQVNVTDVRTSENWKVYWSINGGAADSVTGTGAGSFNFTTANLTVNPSTVRLTRIVNMTTGCEGSPTDQDVVTVSPTTVGGTLSANDTVCKGTNGGTLTLGADAVGTILGWEYSTDNGSTWTAINNTASTYTYSNLTMTTQYRVKVKSGACNEEYSSVVTITVNELPVASIVSVGNNRICEGSSTYVAINVTNVGAGMDWELKYLQGSSVNTLTGTGPGADTIWTGTLSQTTDITFQSMEITSGSPQCSNSSFTNNFKTTITVIDNPTATITSYPTDICKGETPTVSVYVDDVLSSEAWTIVYKVNNGSNITSTGVGSGTFNLANMPAFNTEGPNGVSLISITNTSSNPNCTSMLTDSITINVDSTSVGGTLSGVAIVCKGDGGKLTLSGYRGDITKWQYSTDGINYYDIANTTDTLVFSNLTTKTWYRVEVQNGVCSAAISSVHTVDIQELPTVTINNPTINICSGESTTLSLSIGNVPSTATWSITYTENGTSGSYTTGTGTSETITFGPYTTTTTIEITGITVTNGLGCANTISEKAVVNVTENPIATIATVPDSLCEGEIFTFSVTVDKVETGTDWELDYEIDGAAGPTKKGTGSGTFTVNTGRTVSPNSVMVVLTEIALDNALGCDTDLSDTAEVKVSPTTVGGTLSPSSTTICKGGSATLTLSGETGDVQNWEYSTDNGATWTVLSNKSTSVTITNIEETTLYRVFVKSGTCTGAYSTEAEVTVIPTPMATVTSNARVCPGDVATFTLSVTDVPSTDDWEVTYLRNGVLSTTTVTGTGSGDFNFTVPGSAYNGNPTFITVELVSIENTTHGCLNNDLTSSAQARVTPNPVASFIATNSCEDSTVMFDNTSTIAEGNITTYRWYFGDGDSSFNGSPSHTYSAAGTYNVTLVVWSDNGCRGEVTQTIEIYPNPVADFTFSNVCKNEVFSATDQSSVASGNITSWFWTFGDGSTSTAQNPTHSYAASGNYDVTLTVVTDNGCSNTVSNEVTVYILPEANFVAAPVCEDAPMQFVNASAIGYGTMTYEWDFAGQGTSTDKDPVFTFTGFGTFNVELIATSDNGCKDTIVRAVTVYPAPTADFTVADVCIGDESVFTNTSSVPGTDNIIEYFWDFGDLNFSGLENPTHTYAAAGDYDVTLRVKTDRGCENTVTKTAGVVPLPDVDLTANGPTEFCDGDSVILSANANARTYDWTWDGGTSTDPTVTAKTEGWYKVTISAPPIGCENTDSIFITVWPLPNAKAWPRDKVNQSIDTISRGQSIDLHASGGVTYLWSPITYLNPSDMADVMAERVDDDITYTVTVTDENGCVNTADLSIVVLNNFDLTVYNAVTPNNDGRNDTWIIENIWAYPDAEVIIFNRYGMEVYRGTNYQNDWDATYNGNELPDGPYYYVVIHPDFPDIVYKGVINVIRETTSN